MKQKQGGLRVNWWKWGFILLLSANLAFLTVLAGRLLEVREPHTQALAKTGATDVKVGSFETNRDQLNQTITAYLAKFQTKNLTYQVVVGRQTVMFEGTYAFFSYEVPLYIYFDPYQLEDGRVKLDIASFSVGTLPLPASDVLRYVKSTYQLPSFVTIDPEQASIIVDLTNLDNDAGLYLKARQIDLLNDKISFDLYKKK